MSQTVFRKSSLDRIAGPEQLNSYIRVSSPSVWLILAAIIVLLISVCVWSVFGRIETKIPTKAVVKNGTAMLLLTTEQKEKIEQGQTSQAPLALQIGTARTTLAQPPQAPSDYAALVSTLSPYEQSVYQLEQGEWRYSTASQVDIADGVYSAEIVVESIAPFTFVWN